MHEAKSFCRLCIAACGVVLTIDRERIVGIRADREHPISRGYACFKGLQAADAHHGTSRQLHTLRRGADGTRTRIGTEQALDEVAARLKTVIDRDGPNAVALFRGTAAFHNSTAFRMHGEFLRALGSSSLYTTLTIDQSAKYVAAGRLGMWQAGQVHIDDAEALLVFGCNPLVSHSAGGMLVSDPVKRLKQARARGLKLIVVDPRLSETARHADLFLQPIPGTDAVIAAGLLRLILSDGRHDAAFCVQHVAGLNALCEAVEPFTPEVVAARAGLDADALRAAAAMFATASRRGAVITGTGTEMQPRSNLAEHLIQCLDVVCGHFKRAGEVMRNHDPLQPPTTWFADVVAPTRPWDKVPAGRIRGVGHLYGEKLSATLADEILTPGPGQIKALIVDGANIASSVPDQARMLEALHSLELLVVIDPHLTPTAEQAHVLFSPTLQYERDDLPLTLGKPLYPDAWTQYAAAAIAPPAGSDVIDDWRVFHGLARRLGLALQYGGRPLDLDTLPTTQELLARGLRGSTVTLEQIRQQPDGVWDRLGEPTIVQPARPEAGRFDVAPPCGGRARRTGGRTAGCDRHRGAHATHRAPHARRQRLDGPAQRGDPPAQPDQPAAHEPGRPGPPGPARRPARSPQGATRRDRRHRPGRPDAARRRGVDEPQLGPRRQRRRRRATRGLDQPPGQFEALGRGDQCDAAHVGDPGRG